MVSVVLLLTSVGYQDDATAREDVTTLIKAIEAMQEPLVDFTCEFEGSTTMVGRGAENQELLEGGQLDVYSGLYIWRAGGDVFLETIRRTAPDGAIFKETLVIRPRERRAERYDRRMDSATGRGVVEDFTTVSSSANSVGSIFLTDLLKRNALDERFKVWVTDDVFDGRSMKVYTMGLSDVPNSLMSRFWVDLGRSGQVVRAESYSRGQVSARLDIRLDRFKVGDTEFWMPVAGDQVGYATIVDRRPVILKEPTSRTKIYIVAGTLEFNKRPGDHVFRIDYKPGTPISDGLKKMEFEYGEQRIAAQPTKKEAEEMLTEAVARAEAQNKELVAVPREGIDWFAWLPWGFGGLLMVALMAWSIQRKHA